MPAISEQLAFSLSVSAAFRLALVLGGARSGKSRYGEALIARLPPPWAYIATAQAGDAEMHARIAEHQARRGPDWRTVEGPLDIGAALGACRGLPVLLDCLTLWLSNLLLEERDVQQTVALLEAALDARDAPTVLVANEVGLGIVPDNALARRFRDEAGRLNQRMAARADRVVFMVAGVPMTVKSPREIR